MSKTPWIYCSSIPDDGAVELTPEELRHLVGSHRRRAGESLILFDGSGTVAHAKLGEIKRRPLSGWVKIISQEHHPKPNRKTRLACALPKGDRQGWMLELARRFADQASGQDRFLGSVRRLTTASWFRPQIQQPQGTPR